MDTEIVTHICKIATDLVSSIDIVSQPFILQFFVRDIRVHAHVLVENKEITPQVRGGRHVEADLEIFLLRRDLIDIVCLGCTRDHIHLNGRPDLLLCFRKRFMSISAEGKRVVDELHAARPSDKGIDRVNCESISARSFIDQYAVGSRPVVIHNGMPSWRRSSWDFEKVRLQLSDVLVNVRSGDYTSNIYKESMELVQLTLGSYIDSCANWALESNSTGQPPYAASNIIPPDWHLWLDRPPFIPEQLCSFAKFWIGPAGTSTPLHRDWSDNFLTQLVGSKRLALIAPNHSLALCPKAIHEGLDSCNWVNAFNPMDPLAQKCGPLFLTLEPGEMLFLPAGWFHDVCALSFSFSVNFFVQRVPYAACPPAP